MKNIDLTNKEFSIEYDVYFLGGNCRGIDLHYYKKPDARDEIGELKTWIGPGCGGDAVYIGMDKVGRLLKTKYKSLKRKLHVAIQYRRGLYRLYFHKKRIASFPAKITSLKSIMFELVGNYTHLIDNVKIAEYTTKEKAQSLKNSGSK